MNDTTLPSWRVRPPARTRTGLGVPLRPLLIGGGLLAALGLAALLVWAVASWGPRGVPVFEPDARPFKVRPDQRGGLTVPNQGDLIFERHATWRRDGADQARLLPGPEAPRPEILRAQAAPPPAGAASQAAESVPAAPVAAMPAAPPPAPTRISAPLQAAPLQAAPPASDAAPAGRFLVQVAATASEDGARAEWGRLARRAPELAAREPVVQRLERAGQPPLFRLRAGGFADADSARAFCAGLRSRQVACNVVAPG